MYDWEEAARRESRRNAKLERGIWGNLVSCVWAGEGVAVGCSGGAEEWESGCGAGDVSGMGQDRGVLKQGEGAEGGNSASQKAEGAGPPVGQD